MSRGVVTLTGKARHEARQQARRIMGAMVAARQEVGSPIPPEDRVPASSCSCGWRGVAHTDRATKDGPALAQVCPRCKEPVT